MVDLSLVLGSHGGDDAWPQALVSQQEVTLSSRCLQSRLCGSCCWLPSRTHHPVAVACTLHTSPLHGSLAFLHTSPWQRDPNKKAVVGKAVDSLKEKKSKSMDVDQEAMVLCVLWHVVSLDVHVLLCVQSAIQQKPSLGSRVKAVVLHYFHGFRLLVLDVRVAFRLLLKITRGHTLTRRESKQFRRTVADMFRIVPFSVFIVIPFMEFLLPVYLYFFPNALPSTFQSSSSKVVPISMLIVKMCDVYCVVQADRKKNELKVKLQMAKFLQGTVEEMAVAGRKNKREAVEEFAEFFEKVCILSPGSGSECYSLFRSETVGSRHQLVILFGSPSCLRMS